MSSSKGNSQIPVVSKEVVNDIQDLEHTVEDTINVLENIETQLNDLDFMKPTNPELVSDVKEIWDILETFSEDLINLCKQMLTQSHGFVRSAGDLARITRDTEATELKSTMTYGAYDDYTLAHVKRMWDQAQNEMTRHKEQAKFLKKQAQRKTKQIKESTHLMGSAGHERKLKRAEEEIKRNNQESIYQIELSKECENRIGVLKVLLQTLKNAKKKRMEIREDATDENKDKSSKIDTGMSNNELFSKIDKVDQTAKTLDTFTKRFL